MKSRVFSYNFEFFVIASLTKILLVTKITFKNQFKKAFSGLRTFLFSKVFFFDLISILGFLVW